jgi:hypothetical protein
MEVDQGCKINNVHGLHQISYFNQRATVFEIWFLRRDYKRKWGLSIVSYIT